MSTVAGRRNDTAEDREREFTYAEADFQRVKTLIYRRAGIALSPLKRDLVYGRLARRLRALGMRGFKGYLDALEADAAGAEWEEFTNALTTNLTAFFREAHHFEMLAGHMQASGERPFRIWCCAASTGEEPYSLAMTAVQAFSNWTPPVQILASDIDTRVLEKAAAGVYDAERVEQLPQARLERFFLRGRGAQAGLVRVRPELQRLVRFARVNLLDARWPVQGRLDAIFCRNVMIYFDKPTQYAILARLRPLLRSGGLLYAGHSESFTHAGDLFRARGRTVYEPVHAAVS